MNPRDTIWPLEEPRYRLTRLAVQLYIPHPIMNGLIFRPILSPKRHGPVSLAANRLV